MLLSLLLPAALAYESEPSPLVLKDLADLYEAVEYDSGWLPAGSPVAVAFRIRTAGGALIEMEGESNVSWPTALTQSFTPYAGTGLLELDTALTASVDMNVDIWGYYWEDALASQSLTFQGGTTFEPWLLPGGVESYAEIVDEGRQEELFNLEYDIFSGVTVYLSTDLRPDASVVVNGEKFKAGDQVVAEDGATALHAVPEGGTLELFTFFTARYRSALDLVVVPAFGVCAPVFGCYDVLEFELPINLISTELVQDMPPVVMSFPLPLLDIDTSGLDLGEVEVGQLGTANLPVGNLGDLWLDGSAAITEGSTAFTVFPGELLADAQGTDGLVITFAPQEPGEHTATLVVQTSDPALPTVSIPLRGTAFVEEGPATNIPAEVGCGCASAPGRPIGGLARGGLLLGLLALVLRRRR